MKRNSAVLDPLMNLFSRDENDNVPFIDGLPASTPKKPRNTAKKTVPEKLKCQICGKEYVSKFYFNKHESSHAVQDQVFGSSTSLDVSVIVPTDPNDISFGLLRTPQQGGDVSIAVPDVSFAVPSQPAAKKNKGTVKKKKPHLICTYCLKGYVCSRSFKTHVRAHQIQDTASRYPKVDLIIDNAVDVANKAMSRVATSPSVGKSGQQFKELVGHVAGIEPLKWSKFSRAVCTELVGVLRDKKCLLPSALASTLIDQVESMLSNRDLCDKLMLDLGLVGNFSDTVISQFYLEFCLKLMQESLKFIRTHFQEKVALNPAKEINLDKEDRQVIYYIAGSIMRSYLKIARRAKKSDSWQNIATTLQSNVLVDKPVGDILEDSEWTMEVDRGGLLYINTDSQQFFVNLTKVVFESEGCDGSIDYESVLSKVSNSDMCVQWDNIISDSLKESISVGLMNDVILLFCRTCCRGFVRRRLNFLRIKPIVSMPTRHLVASRKNR